MPPPQFVMKHYSCLVSCLLHSLILQQPSASARVCKPMSISLKVSLKQFLQFWGTGKKCLQVTFIGLFYAARLSLWLNLTFQRRSSCVSCISLVREHLHLLWCLGWLRGFFNLLLPTCQCPSMLQLQLYCYRCMHKARLWLNTLCIDGVCNRIVLRYYGDLNCLLKVVFFFFFFLTMQLVLDFILKWRRSNNK